MSQLQCLPGAKPGRARSGLKQSATLWLVALLAFAVPARALNFDFVYTGPLSGSFGTNGNWDLNLVPGSTGLNFRLVLDNNTSRNVTVNVDSTISNALSSDIVIDSGDTLNIASGFNLTLNATSATVVNNGTFKLSSTGATTDLILTNGSVTFGGTGSLTLSNNANNRVRGTNGASDKLINDATHTIKGAGQLGVNLMGIDNAGLILADQSNSLVVDPSSLGVTNTGTMRATGGATLALQNGTFTNTGGLIKADDNSHIDLTSATITGGTLTSVNSGHFHSLGSSNTFSALTISSGTNIEIGNADRLNLSGAIVNAGTIKVLGSGSFTDLVATSPTTLTGNGSITLANGNSRIYGGTNTTTLTNTANTISGAGNIGAGTLQFVNQSLVDANLSGGTLTLQASGTGTTNTATLRASNGGTLTISGSSVTNTGGTVEAQTGSVVNLSNTTLTNGTIVTSGTGSIRATGGSTLSGITLSNSATNLRFENSSINNLGATVTNNGTITINSTGTQTDVVAPAGGLNLTGGGIVQMNSAARLYSAGTGITLTNSNNTIRGTGNIGAGQTPLVNNGTIEASTNGGTLTISPGGTGVDNNATLRATNGGILALAGGLYDNTGGLIESQASSMVTLTGTTLTGGTFTAAPGGAIEASASNTLSGITVSPATTLTFVNGSTNTLSGTIANSGTLSIHSTGSTTDLQVAAAGVTLTGGGTVTLTSSARLYGVNGTATLTNTNNTIRGVGNIGAAQLQFTNHGTVEANVAAGTLTIQPSGTGVVNDGSLIAVGGGILTLSGNTFTNFTNSGSLDNGLIQAQANSFLNFNSTTVTGGMLDLGPGATLGLNGSTVNGSTFSLASTGLIKAVSGTNVLGGVVNNGGGQIEVGNGSALRLLSTGTFNNGGNIKVGSTGSTTDLVMSGGDVTLSGGGTVTLTNFSANRIYGVAGTDRLINANNIISGAGEIGVGLMGLVNHHIIEATQPTTPLIINPSATGAINDGTLRAASGATLRLSGSTLDSTGGSIEALNASTVELSSVSITGGSFNTVGTGAIRNTGSATLTAPTFTVGSNFSGPNGTSTTFNGAINNGGVLNLASTGSTTDFMIGTGGATLSGGGTIIMSGFAGNRLYGANGSVTLTNIDNVISGSGQIGVNQTIIVNAGQIEASNPAAPLIIDPSSTVTNTGLMHASNGATLQLASGTIDNTGGTIGASGANAKVKFSGATVSGGTLSSDSGAVLEVSGASTLSSLSLASGSTLQVLNGIAATIQGSLNNEGTIIVQSTGNQTDLIVGAGGATLDGGGIVELTGFSSNRIYGSAGANTLTINDQLVRGAGELGANQLTLVNHGQIEANNANPLVLDVTGTSFTNHGVLLATGTGGLHLSDTTFLNNGLVGIEAGSHVTAAGAFSQTGPSATLLNGGTVTAASFNLGHSGILGGAGTITGAVTNDGLISPGGNLDGPGIGQLVFNNNLTLSSGSFVHIELGGTSSFDTIQAPTMTLGGTLAISFAGKFENSVAVGNSFVVLMTTNATGLSGTFNGITNGSLHPTIDGYGFFQVNYGLNNVTLSNFTAVPEPSTYALFGLGLATLAALRRRKT